MNLQSGSRLAFLSLTFGHDAEDDDKLECEYCGAPTDRLVTVSDCDRSVGYHGKLRICEPCAVNVRNHCGVCA